MAEVADPSTQIQPYLKLDEQLLWSGRPDPDARFGPADVLMVPFSLVWGAFALFWEVSVVANGASAFLVVSGFPLLAIGAYMVVGRFAVKRHRKLRTAYAVTSQRALIAVGHDTLLDAPIKPIPTVVRRSRDKRHVSVSLGNQGLFRFANFYGNTGLDFHNAYGGPLTFYDVTDGDDLIRAIDEARSSPSAEGRPG